MSASHNNDLLVAQLEVHLIARLQAGAISQRLRDDDLSLRPYPASHTAEV
jgi:hypothetical protein